MHLPGRHKSAIDAPVERLEGWDGSIAYLDRDGVLNVGREDYVKSVDEVVMLTGAGHAVAALREAGYRIVIVTNQSPVNRGMFSHEDLELMNQAVLDGLLEENANAYVDVVLYSPYAPWEQSPVRKPGAGMLQVGRQLLSELELEVKTSQCPIGISTSRRPLIHGRRSGCRYGCGIPTRCSWFSSRSSIGLAGILERALDDDDEGDALEI